MSLAIGIGTRGRASTVVKTAEETLKHVSRSDTTIIVLGDHDDEELKRTRFPAGVILNIQQREDSLGGKWNRLLRISTADVYLVMVDYGPNITDGFDQKILDAALRFKDGIGVLCNHLANLSFPTSQAVTHRMAEIMGGVYTENFPYWFVDHWLDDIAKMIGRLSFVDFSVDCKQRPGTMERREPGLWAALYDALEGEREEVANRLLENMDEPEWRKELLRSSWPIIHQRSRMINAMVRGIEATDRTVDSRYLRMRDKALEKLNMTYQRMKEAA